MSQRKQKPRVEVSEYTKNRLYLRKRVGDTWDDVVARLLDAAQDSKLEQYEKENL